MTVAPILSLALLLATDEERIRPCPDHPRYWEYQGKPVLLLGGSVEDNLFQIPELEAHLDLLKSVGGNYVRNTMSSRDEGNVWPFAQREDGKYDLTKPNEEYWRRFAEFLRLTHERNIILQIELWDRFDFAREPWLVNPYNPRNNVNYTSQESGLKPEYPNHPGGNENPFFRAVPELEDNELVLRFQQAQVDQMLSISLSYPNVLYCMDNETSGKPEWGAYWSRYIQAKADEAGVSVQTTEMWDPWDLSAPQHRHTFDHPELYSFVDVSQNNHQKGQTHWDNFQRQRERIAEQPRPLNNVKIYGADTGRYGTDRDGIERFWRNLLGGAASARFHRPDSGLGLSATAQAHLQSARMLTDSVEFFDCEPSNELLSDREPNEAYLGAQPGEAYLLYFPDGGAVTLALPEQPNEWVVRWLEIEKAQWGVETKLRAGQSMTLTAMSRGHWAVRIVRGE